MKRDIHIYQYRDDKYAVRIQVKQGKIIKCGYRRKCGVWHYRKSNPYKWYHYSITKDYFDNGEPKTYITILDYALYVLFCKNKNEFDNLVKAVPKEENVQGHELLHPMFNKNAQEMLEIKGTIEYLKKYAFLKQGRFEP